MPNAFSWFGDHDAICVELGVGGRLGDSEVPRRLPLGVYQVPPFFLKPTALQQRRRFGRVVV